MKSGWPPTAPKARAGLFTPPGRTRLARSKASRLRTRMGGIGEFSSIARFAWERAGCLLFRLRLQCLVGVGGKLRQRLVRAVLVELVDFLQQQIGVFRFGARLTLDGVVQLFLDLSFQF